MTVKYEMELFLRNMYAVNAVLTERSIRYHFIAILKGSWLISIFAILKVFLSIPKRPPERHLGCAVVAYTDE
jgi:hypothetical protein